ncbi:MAG: family 10 glycosylhydrolase [candidate division WOR-3 bacterium]|nr:MAG: family 10 glycosylhydrolase [candidate division WOR-3 bacterium]
MFVSLLLTCVAFNEFQHGLWVRASSIAHGDSMFKVVERATELGVTDIYAQVVIAGYAYYDSDILPRSQYLSRVSEPEYDPLDSLIRTVRSKPIRVHAWVNALLVWSLDEPPDSMSHVLYSHPEWFLTDVHKRRMAHYTHQQWESFGLEGLFLDPYQHEVREYLASVCGEIARKYPVDGIHLDFIRYPGTLWGLPDTDEAMIFAGLEADTLRWLNLTRYPRLSFYLRWMVWHYSLLNQTKEQTIFQTVEHVRRSIEKNALNKNCVLSAAVFANPSLAQYRFAQGWWRWGEVLDFPVVMSYTQDIRLFTDFVDFGLTHRRDAVFGIGFLWPHMEAEAFWQEEAVNQKLGQGVCYFDYTNIDTMVDVKKLKVQGTIDSTLIDTTRYSVVDNVFTDSANPCLVEDGEAYVSWGDDLEFSAFLLSMSLNPERDLARMNMSREDFIEQIRKDEAAFQSLDKAVFPLGDELIEPPRRVVSYTFLPWEEDSAAIREQALQVKRFAHQEILYPRAMDHFARAVFGAEKGRHEICETAEGIYVFRVERMLSGGKKVWRKDIKLPLLPVYENWTIQMRFRTKLY